jgi:hypothetical protein
LRARQDIEAKRKLQGNTHEVHKTMSKYGAHQLGLDPGNKVHLKVRYFANM